MGRPHEDARYWRVPRRRRLWPAIVGWGAYALASLTIAIVAGGYIYLDDTLSSAAPDTPEARAARAATQPALPGGPQNILLIGSDSRPSEGDPGRSDTLILLRLDPKQDFISMLSFPRDLYVPIPGHSDGRINEAYSYGAATTIETIKQLTGEPVNGYVIVGFDGFSKLVDQVGGVYIDVDRRYYNKNVGTIATNFSNIDIQPGYQKLNGYNALAYVRYRHTDSTYSRDSRQQLFLSELKRQTKDLGNLVNITGFRRTFSDTIETDITSVPRFISLLEQALVTPEDRVARASVQGTDGFVGAASVQEATPAAVAQAVAAWKEPRFIRATTAAKPRDPTTVDVTVLNGSGRLLAAESVAEALATKGYPTAVGGDATAPGGAADFGNPVSAVYYAPAYRDAALKVQQLMGPSATLGALDTAQARGNEVVVVAGADWTGTLAAPPTARETRPPADTVDTTALVAPIRAVRSKVPGTKVMAPLKVARGARVRIVRPYRIDAGGTPTALKIVFDVMVGGQPKYWGIEMTDMKNPPILAGDPGTYTSGGRRYYTFYDGRNLQRIAFQSGGTTYWVSNTLGNDLSAKTIEDIAKSMRPLSRARLKAGLTDTPMTVDTAAVTP